MRTTTFVGTVLLINQLSQRERCVRWMPALGRDLQSEMASGTNATSSSPFALRDPHENHDACGSSGTDSRQENGTINVDLSEYFSTHYDQARNRFRGAAADVDAFLASYPVAHDDDLTIDVAQLPASRAANKVVVVSSGVHGIEGPFGSAVQLAWLDQLRERGLPSGVRVVLIHSVNPFGFANDRRWNEDGIDLNRNFLSGGEAYAGAPEGYVKLDRLLNPDSPPSRWEPFRAKAAWNILRYGTAALKDAIATGQYEYPRGLFFGGKEPSGSFQILREHYASWIGDASEIVHLDLHTGLGRFAEYRVLVDADADSDDARWFHRLFAADVVEADTAEGTAYHARGTFGGWAKKEMAGHDFRFATVDFGTYGLVRVLAALRAENRVYHHAKEDNRFGWVQQELRECFCPASGEWRQSVVRAGLEVIAKSIAAS